MIESTISSHFYLAFDCLMNFGKNDVILAFILSFYVSTFKLYLSLTRILTVITGGLDSKLVMWDFSKGRPVKIVDFGMYISYLVCLNRFYWYKICYLPLMGCRKVNF